LKLPGIPWKFGGNWLKLLGKWWENGGKHKNYRENGKFQGSCLIEVITDY